MRYNEFRASRQCTTDENVIVCITAQARHKCDRLDFLHDGFKPVQHGLGINGGPGLSFHFGRRRAIFIEDFAGGGDKEFPARCRRQTAPRVALPEHPGHNGTGIKNDGSFSHGFF